MHVDELICTPRSTNFPSAFARSARNRTIREMTSAFILSILPMPVPSVDMRTPTYVRSGILVIALLLCRVAHSADVQNKVDWEKFLARHDLVFNKLPEKWGE